MLRTRMAHFGIIGHPHEGQTEIYARTVSTFADNVIATTRISNNAMFANMESFKTFIQREKDDIKEFSRMGDTNAAKTFAQTSRDVAREHDQKGY